MGALIGLLIGGVAGFWVATDAKKRGMNSVVWGIFTFLVFIIGLPVYLISRKPLLENED